MLLLSGCVYEEEAIQPASAQLANTSLLKVTDEEELVYEIEMNLQKDKMKTLYQCDIDLDLDKTVLLLSYLVPFDLQLKRYSVQDEKGKYYVAEIEYMDENSEMCIQEAEKIVKNIIGEQMSIQEKVDVIHRYIIDRCVYDKSIVERNEQNEQAFQTYGVLFKGNGVCTGYARTFLLLLKESGVPCMYIPSDTMNHSFNLVYTDRFSFVDVTWDDPNMTYYGLNLKHFFADGKHVFDPGYSSEYYMNFMSYIYHLKT